MGTEDGIEQKTDIDVISQTLTIIDSEDSEKIYLSERVREFNLS